MLEFAVRHFIGPGAMAAKHRFQVTQHLLRIIGVCAECRRAMKEAGKEELAPRVRAKATARAR